MDWVPLLVIALLNAFTAAMSWQTMKMATRTEQNTNSMKDALVAATASASHAAGREEMRAENLAEHNKGG